MSSLPGDRWTTTGSYSRCSSASFTSTTSNPAQKTCDSRGLQHAPPPRSPPKVRVGGASSKLHISFDVKDNRNRLGKLHTEPRICACPLCALSSAAAGPASMDLTPSLYSRLSAPPASGAPALPGRGPGNKAGGRSFPGRLARSCRAAGDGGGVGRPEEGLLRAAPGSAAGGVAPGLSRRGGKGRARARGPKRARRPAHARAPREAGRATRGARSAYGEPEEPRGERAQGGGVWGAGRTTRGARRGGTESGACARGRDAGRATGQPCELGTGRTEASNAEAGHGSGPGNVDRLEPPGAAPPPRPYRGGTPAPVGPGGGGRRAGRGPEEAGRRLGATGARGGRQGGRSRRLTRPLHTEETRGGRSGDAGIAGTDSTAPSYRLTKWRRRPNTSPARSAHWLPPRRGAELAPRASASASR